MPERNDDSRRSAPSCATEILSMKPRVKCEFLAGARGRKTARMSDRRVRLSRTAVVCLGQLSICSDKKPSSFFNLLFLTSTHTIHTLRFTRVWVWQCFSSIQSQSKIHRGRLFTIRMYIL